MPPVEGKTYPKFAWNKSKPGDLPRRFETAEEFHEANSADGGVWFDNPQFIKEKNGVRQTPKQIAVDKAEAEVDAAEEAAAGSEDDDKAEGSEGATPAATTPAATPTPTPAPSAAPPPPPRRGRGGGPKATT